MSLRIGIDGRALQGNRSGIGRYIFELCRELDKCLPNTQFFVYSQFPVEMPVFSERWISRCDTLISKKYMKSAVWLKLRCGYLCKKDNLDVFWGSATLLPKLPQNMRIISTVYDLNHIIVPKTMPTYTFWAYKLFFKHDLERANAIISISRGTSDRLLTHLSLPTSAIVPPAISDCFRPQLPETIKDCLKHYNVNNPYILAVATWEPRKNLELLIKTYLEMKNDGLLTTHKLVLVGGKGWKDERLSNLVAGNKESIMPLGFVPDVHLPSLYSGADIFVFPSIYEGFGMPVLEARACGTRVVTSDIPELREAGGDSAVYITPDASGIRKGILTALSQTPQNKIIDYHVFSWHEGARTLVDFLTD